MKPVCEYLSKKLNKEVILISQNIFEIDPKYFSQLGNDKIFFLEKIRFYEQEEKMIQNLQKYYSNLEKFLLMMLFLVHTEHMHL